MKKACFVLFFLGCLEKPQKEILENPVPIGVHVPIHRSEMGGFQVFAKPSGWIALGISILAGLKIYDIFAWIDDKRKEYFLSHFVKPFLIKKWEIEDVERVKTELVRVVSEENINKEKAALAQWFDEHCQEFSLKNFQEDKIKTWPQPLPDVTTDNINKKYIQDNILAQPANVKSSNYIKLAIAYYHKAVEAQKDNILEHLLDVEKTGFSREARLVAFRYGILLAQQAGLSEEKN